MRARATLFATTAAVFALAGCKDSGLPDRNLPHEEAAHRAPDALVLAVHPGTRGAAGAAAAAGDPHAAGSMATRPVTLGDQTFVASGMPARLDAGSLRTVGGGPDGSFSAALGDTPPYDRLYLSHPGGLYITYLPVHDVSGDPVARAAALEHAMEAGPVAH